MQPEDTTMQRRFASECHSADRLTATHSGPATLAGIELAPVAIDQFRQVMRNLAGGVAVVAAGTGNGRRGLTVSAVASVSAEPPCLLVCVNRNAEAHDVILARGSFSVNLLGIEHKELAMRFAGHNGIRGLARFELGSWSEGLLGVPLLNDALGSMECDLLTSPVVGSHRLFVGKIVCVRNRSGEPLVNFQGRLQTIEAA
jgi:flavin reductase (DIM6/NTAB) family NADH-FMN oxidoreductase RutF